MVNPSICAPCRTRKVRCDSQQPECGQCLQARRMFQCTYDVPTSKPTRDNLRKGEACMPCRRKKKKCDAAQPICDRCSAAGIGHECFYKERAPQKSPTLKDTTIIPLDTPQDSSPNLSPTSTPSSGRSPQYAFPGNTAGLQFSVTTGSSNDVALASPLDIDQPNTQITSMDDLDTSFRLLFLARREQFGIYLPFGKHQAVILGDMSNACVHPFFVHFSHAIGCHFHEARHANFSIREMETTHLARAYDTLQQMEEADDPFIYGQAHHYLGLGALYSQPIATAIAYHEEAVKIVERNGLHILKDTGHMISDLAHLEASEVLERAVFLGTLLAVEILLDVVGVKKRTLCYAIEKEYRYRFPEAFPFLFQTSPSILRVRGLLLFKEASDTIDSAAHPGVEAGTIADNCLVLIPTLTSHVDGLTNFAIEPPNENNGSEVSLRSNLVESWTALAEMFDLMSRISPEPLATDYRRKFITALMRAVEVVHGMGHDDSLVVELFLAISLKRLSALLDFAITQLCRAPIEGIDLDSLSSGAAILKKAKEFLRAALQLACPNPNSLPSKLSGLLI